jgi:hypothetical protein
MRADKIACELGNLEPSVELPEHQWREIELAVGIEGPDKLFRCRVEHCAQLAFAARLPSFGEVGGLKTSTAKKYISKIHKDAERLAKTLSKLQTQAELGDKNADWALFNSAHLWGQLLHQIQTSGVQSSPGNDFRVCPKTWEVTPPSG